ncbi:ATP-binding protein [Anoxynatronum buryatiense]|uniref:DNA replication protein DnaC n=1 Tax=Anoxynatronum buryatiense TaxID=489973 RepID=A0AA46AJ83_9CLOT|nr:ATP-binding protein [Anoxynatronum buryatiense]SMP58637.1 DNA replication protein DnaC [Anoxynatronum buryatiense]
MRRSAVVQEIMKDYEKKRRMAQRRREEKVQAIYEMVPELEALESQMTRQGLAISRALLSDPQNQQRLIHQLEQEMNRLQERRSALMNSHHLTEADFQPHWSCAHCQDRGILKSGKHCSCFKQQLINQAYQMSNLAGILAKENFKTFRIDLFSEKEIPEEGLSPRDNMLQVLQECEGFVFNFDEPNEKNLLFYGPTGLGKTFMANCIAKALLDREKVVIYQTAIKLIHLLENHQFGREGTPQDSQVLTRLFDCDLLIIDDLGTELTNTFTNGQLFQIINTRHLEGKKTLISTNLPPGELMVRYDDRICSRLFAYYSFVKFFGKDIRWEGRGAV